MSVLKYLEKNFELIVMSILLAIFTVLMFTNVVLRYVAKTSIVWGDEVCRYALVASTFFSIPIWIRPVPASGWTRWCRCCPSPYRGPSTSWSTR